jgi:RimJ/RimL family protein N-acetyltransferase
MTHFESRLEMADPAIYLRAPQPADAELLFATVTDPINNAHLGATEPWARGFALEDARQQVENVSRRMAEGGDIMQYFVVSNENEALLGCTTLFDYRGSSAILGCWLVANACGKGYAAQSTRRVIEYGAEAWGLEEVVLRIADDNIASQKAARKNGADPTGWTVSVETNGRTYDKRIWLVGAVGVEPTTKRL